MILFMAFTKAPIGGDQTDAARLTGRAAMKRRLAISAAALIIAAGLALPAQSQQNTGGISAGISAIWGQALVHHDSMTGWAIAQSGQPLMPGDSIMATQGSRLMVALGDAAITLHPGAQMDWAGQNGPTPVVRLDQGRSEISLPPSRWNIGLSLLTPWGMARLEQPGSYGVNLDRNGHLRLVVWSGFASLPAMGLEVRPGQMAMLTANGAALALAPSQQPVMAPAVIYVPETVIQPNYEHRHEHQRAAPVVMAVPQHIQAELPRRQEFHHEEPLMHVSVPEPHRAEPEHQHQQAQASSPPPASHDHNHDHEKPDRK
jgi:hypothetical protein